MEFHTKKKCCICGTITSIADFGEVDLKNRMYCFDHVESMWSRVSTSQNKVSNTSQYWDYLEKVNGFSPRPKQI